jgi:hypothetical protein
MQSDAKAFIDFRLLHLIRSQPSSVGAGELHFVAVAEYLR